VDQLATIDREATALRRAAGRDLMARVPGCPEWNVTDLVRHIGEVHDVWAWVLASGTESEAAMQAYEAPGRPSDDQLIPWAEARTALLLAAIEVVDPGAPRWNWSGQDQTARWIGRRMLHETVIHRWDAESATGTPGPIASQVAADGIDEYLRVFLLSSGDYHGPSGTLGLATTDTAHGWSVEFAPPAVRVTDSVDTAEAQTWAAPAEALLLRLWERGERTDIGPLAQALLDHVRRG
jgi:uncharacterized protein (TIGR03083 family)